MSAAAMKAAARIQASVYSDVDAVGASVAESERRRFAKIIDEEMGRAAERSAALVKGAGEKKYQEALLELVTFPHYECEDSWYSCPLSPGGCLDERLPKECNCPAERVRRIARIALDAQG